MIPQCGNLAIFQLFRFYVKSNLHFLGDHGKLGHGDTARHYRPKVIDNLQGLDIAKIVAGNLVSMALTQNGEIWVWGSGPCLGLGSAEAVSLAPQGMLLFY